MLQCDDCGKLTRELCTVMRHPPNMSGVEPIPYFDICRECFHLAELKFSREVGEPPRPFVATVSRFYGGEVHG